MDGKAIAPASAPDEVERVIDAANELVGKPYRWGGGHRQFTARLPSALDCSGLASWALYGGGFLDAPMTSGGLAGWEKRGRGEWITVFANSEHVYLVIRGARLDTSRAFRDPGSPRSGAAWSSRKRSPAGFQRRHPEGF